jgi:hypothetical protein
VLDTRKIQVWYVARKLQKVLTFKASQKRGISYAVLDGLEAVIGRKAAAFTGLPNL